MGKRMDAKSQALREQGSLNPRPQSVTDPLFHNSEFLDPRDLVQVKYEMLRRVQAEAHSVAQAAKAFGFSRPTFYQISGGLSSTDGLPGLGTQAPGTQGARTSSSAPVLGVYRSADGTDDPAAAQLPNWRAASRKHWGLSVHLTQHRTGLGSGGQSKGQ